MTCGWMIELTNAISSGTGFAVNGFGTLFGNLKCFVCCCLALFIKKVGLTFLQLPYWVTISPINFSTIVPASPCPYTVYFFVCFHFFTLTYTVLQKWSLLIFQTSPSLFLSLTCVRGAWKAMIIDVTPTRTQCWRLCVSFGNIIMMVITQTMMMIIFTTSVPFFWQDWMSI